MKIIIEHSCTKRVIEGPFNICGTWQDLRCIAEQILAKKEIGDGYGWINITEGEQPSIANDEPISWDARGYDIRKR